MNQNDHYIVTESVREIKVLSALHMRYKPAVYFLGIVIYYLIYEVVPNILGVIFPRGYMEVTGIKLSEQITKQIGQIQDIPFIMIIYAGLMSGVLLLGLNIYVLKYLRNREPDPLSVFDGFSLYFKALLISIMTGFLVSVGLMIFVVPGFIALLAYSQTFYILADDPSKGPVQCMRESRRMMQGNKSKLFSLVFSYILLLLIAAIPVMVFQYTGIKTSTIGGAIAYELFRIPLFYAMGCIYLAEGTFYELLVSHGFENFRYAGEKIFRENCERARQLAEEQERQAEARSNDDYGGYDGGYAEGSGSAYEDKKEDRTGPGDAGADADIDDDDAGDEPDGDPGRQ